MNKRILIPLILGLASTPLAARPMHLNSTPPSHYAKAQVVEVKPIIEVVQIPTERRECWTEEVSGTRTRHSHSGTLVGGILGGVIGHHIGKGDGAATAAGTIIGAAVGHDADRDGYKEPYHHTERRCEVREEYYEEERVSGYRVTYRFNGSDYTTRMDHDPGRFVRLRIQHTLVE